MTPPTWEPVQHFIFNSNAHKVYDFIMGPEAQWPREIQRLDPQYRLACRLCPGFTTQGLYCISLVITLTLRFQAGNPPFILENGEPLLNGELAQIIICQEQVGQSQAVLNIDTSLLRRDWIHLSPADVTVGIAGQTHIVAIWRALIEDWIACSTQSIQHRIKESLDDRVPSPEEAAALQAMVTQWIAKEQGRQSRADTGARRPGGRPVEADDDWAYQQVDILHRDRYSVYQEWLKRIPVERRRRLEDTYNASTKALYRRRRRSSSDD